MKLFGCFAIVAILFNLAIYTGIGVAVYFVGHHFGVW